MYQRRAERLRPTTDHTALTGVANRWSIASPWLRVVCAAVTLAAASSATHAATGIRVSQTNTVPTCVTPGRLMAFLKDHNANLAPQFQNIAALYKAHGQHWNVRWDYAFFQMAVETNFLTFRRGNGQPGDVHISQNNFAGLGATGGGVPGDRYPSVSNGVLAQIHHLVVYSGERVEMPAGHRTRLKQNHILHLSTQLAERRPVTFQDLAGRWAADRKYGRTISAIAQRFYTGYCSRPNARHVNIESWRKDKAPPAPRAMAQPILASKPTLVRENRMPAATGEPSPRLINPPRTVSTPASAAVAPPMLLEPAQPKERTAADMRMRSATGIEMTDTEKQDTGTAGAENMRTEVRRTKPMQIEVVSPVAAPTATPPASKAPATTQKPPSNAGRWATPALTRFSPGTTGSAPSASVY